MQTVISLLENRLVNLGIRAGLVTGTIVIFGYVGLSDRIFNPYFQNTIERVYYTKPDYANKSVVFYHRDIPHTIREV